MDVASKASLTSQLQQKVETNHAAVGPRLRLLQGLSANSSVPSSSCDSGGWNQSAVALLGPVVLVQRAPTGSSLVAGKTGNNKTFFPSNIVWRMKKELPMQHA